MSNTYNEDVARRHNERIIEGYERAKDIPLANCPFCGSPSLMRIEKGYINHVSCFQYLVLGCSKQYGCIAYRMFATEEPALFDDAIKQWNERAIPAAGRLIALQSSCGDEFDCEHLVVPGNMDVEAERQAYDTWEREVYRPSNRTEERRAEAGIIVPPPPKDKAVPYEGFEDWLIEKGARFPDDAELLVIDI